MTLWRLVTREIRHRKLSFALGALSAMIAVGVLVAELTLLRAHDARTRDILARKEAQTAQRLLRLEDDYRKIMKKLGFNVLILPTGEGLGDFYAQGYASQFMPESYVETLASSKIMTVRHLLPILEQRVTWSQGRRKIILAGVRGEVPLPYRAPNRPILQSVAPGKIVLGYELWHGHGLKVGDAVELMGGSFVVSKCYAERGTKDDVTAWINLAQAQEMLGKKDLINAIMALECICVGVDVAAVRREITRILPETQVKELASMALTRAEARQRAAVEHEQALAAEREGRARLRRQREASAAWLVPLVIVGCTAWIGLLSLANVRQRAGEIGILRALGLRSRQILTVFLARAALIGAAGAATGYLIGFAVGVIGGELASSAGAAATLFSPGLLVAVMLAAPALSALAGWAPATRAARQDPAVVLREE
jgi:putative ABC transport system permease protein